MGLLSGKTVIVTGAGRGVGRAHAIALAREGAAVVVNDIGAEMSGVGHDRSLAAGVADTIIAEGGRAVADDSDISSWEGAKRLVDNAYAAFGRLDGLVNNAGNQRRQALADLEQEDLAALVGVHVTGAFACTVQACRRWRDTYAQAPGPQGAIVNTFSEAVLVGLPNYVAYGGAKAAVLHLTTAGSRETAAFGVRINAYAPRALTRMLPGYVEGMEGAEGSHPMDPGNSSPLVAWLLSDQSLHVTGQAFQTVGGSIARCEPWTPAPLIHPPEGQVRFEMSDIGATMNAEIFRSKFPERALA
jgi:NAD(P)-dependent dehydrogenase (short-subunit alcohol dehydrogenase family)